MYSLRKAKKEDFDFLRTLHRLTLKPYVEEIWGWDETFQLKIFRDRFNPEKIQIVQSSGKDIGVLEIEKKEKEIFLANFLLLPDYQNKGIGSQILKDIIHEANGLPITLSVLRPNPAKKFYERLGFVPTFEDEIRCYMRK